MGALGLCPDAAAPAHPGHLPLHWRPSLEEARRRGGASRLTRGPGVQRRAEDGSADSDVARGYGNLKRSLSQQGRGSKPRLGRLDDSLVWGDTWVLGLLSSAGGWIWL